LKRRCVGLVMCIAGLAFLIASMNMGRREALVTYVAKMTKEKIRKRLK